METPKDEFVFVKPVRGRDSTTPARRRGQARGLADTRFRRQAACPSRAACCPDCNAAKPAPPRTGPRVWQKVPISLISGGRRASAARGESSQDFIVARKESNFRARDRRQQRSVIRCYVVWRDIENAADLNGFRSDFIDATQRRVKSHKMSQGVGAKIAAHPANQMRG